MKALFLRVPATVVFSGMGLTSNPTIFDGAIANNDAYDAGILAKIANVGIAVDAVAPQLQVDGAQSLVKSCWALLARVGAKSAALAGAGQVVV